MKKINLLPWREPKDKLKIKPFVIALCYISCFYFILLLIAKIITIQQIKHYQLDNGDLLFQIKKISIKVQEVKKLKSEKNELKNLVKTIQINQQKIKKIVDLMNHLQYLITPDLFVRLVEFYSPYLSFVMHANSINEYTKLKKFLKSNLDYKIQWLILNQFQNSQLDFIVNFILQSVNKVE